MTADQIDLQLLQLIIGDVYIGKASETGAATVVLAGISVGFESAVYTAIVIAAVVAWVVMRRSGLGFQIRAIGLNPQASRMNGMHVGRVAVVARRRPRRRCRVRPGPAARAPSYRP